MTTAVEELDVLVIGAGFAGVYQLDRLRSLGHSVKVVEAGAGLGGIWYWNCYPGARVDTEGPLYQFAYKDLWKGWKWRQLYPGWREVREYFAYVDRKLDISKHVRFNARVEAAEFDTDRNQWVVHASDGTTVRCSYLVPCLGFAGQPYLPPIPGRDTFAGPCHHTALWPQEGVDLRGKLMTHWPTPGRPRGRWLPQDLAFLQHFCPTAGCLLREATIRSSTYCPVLRFMTLLQIRGLQPVQ